MSEKEFLDKYFKKITERLEKKDFLDDLLRIKKILLETHKSGKKTMIFGNGGSAAIASHFSVDLTKNAKVRCTNYNESDLITCFSNDYGYEMWVEKAIELYGDEGDSVILISSSGESKNMTNAAKYVKKNNFKSLITFSGNKKDNSLCKMGDVNIWVDSKAYNLIENIHQILLLSLVDLIIGKSEYPPN